MRKAFGTLLFLFATFVVATAVRAADGPSSTDSAKLQATLQANYDAMNADLARGDIKDYLAFRTADFKEVDLNNAPLPPVRSLQMKFNDHVDWTTYYSDKHLTPVESRDRIISVIGWIGHSALVTTETGHAGEVQWFETKRDVWVQHGGIWLLKSRRDGTLFYAD